MTPPPTVQVYRADGISVLDVRGLEYRGDDEQGRAHWRGSLTVWPGDKVVTTEADSVVIELPQSGQERQVDNEGMSRSSQYTHTALVKGDRVLVTFSDRLSREQADALQDRLVETFEGVEFVVVGGVSAVVVEHAEQP